MDEHVSELLSHMKTSCVVYFLSTDGPADQYYLNGGNAYVCASKFSAEVWFGFEPNLNLYPDPEHAKTVVADPQYWRTPFVRKLFGFDDPKTGNHKQRRKRERDLRLDFLKNFRHCSDIGMFMFGVCPPCASVSDKRSNFSLQVGSALLSKENAHPRLIAEVERCFQDANLQAFYNYNCSPLPKNVEDVEVFIEYRRTYDRCWSRAVVLYDFPVKIPLDISEETLMQCTPCVPPQWSHRVNEQLYEYTGDEFLPIDARLLWDCFDEDGRINDYYKFEDDLFLAVQQFMDYKRF